MNKTILILLSLIILISGCTNEQNIENNTINDSVEEMTNLSETITNITEETVELSNETEILTKTITPISEFTIDDISYLGVNCEQGSDLEIANCIKDWQGQNMIYLGLTESSATYPDAADSIHWNYALPGVFPTKEVIRQRSEGNKPYGVCYDYATIYCSIAEYYGLNCRVANSIIKPSQRPESTVEFTTGLQYEEFERMQIELTRQKLDYDFILMNKVLRETPEHFWAEVFIEDEWIIMDGSGTNTQTRYKDVNDWEESNWTKFYEESNILEYINTLDDLNNRIRIFDNGDYIFSEENNLGLTVPYYATCEDSCPFFKGSLTLDCVPDCNSYKSAYECYESCSDEKYYIICDYVCGEIEDINEASICYESCSGQEINLVCDEQCLDD